MGMHAAKCMAGESDELGAGLAFEIFAHSTRFFGQKLVLIGRYNAQDLGAAEEEVARTAVVTDQGLLGTASTAAAATDRIVPRKRRADEGDGEASGGGGGGSGGGGGGGGGGGLGSGVEFLTRVSPGASAEYVKVVVVGGRVQGAMLVGDTELEEAMEHLILDQTDISSYGEWLLDDNVVDVADYFD